MSADHPPKPFYATATGGIFIVIATVVILGGIFVGALISGASH